MLETTRTGSRTARTDTDASRDQKTPDFADHPASNPDDREANRAIAQDSLSSGDSTRVMTDGGLVDDHVDPTDLTPRRTPAYIQLVEDGQIFVSTYTILDSGWVSVTHWDRERQKFPPHRVQMIQNVRTEQYGEPDANGFRSTRLVDESQRQEARRLAQPTETDDVDQEAVADD